MKLIIDIPEETYEEVKSHGLFLTPQDEQKLVNSIKGGVPCVNGKWEDDRMINEFWIANCSNCGNTGVIADYCMWCGADMREGEAE